jgi:hypothetical protein
MTFNGGGEIRMLLSQHGLGRIRVAVTALEGRMPALVTVPDEAAALRVALLQIRDALRAGKDVTQLVDLLLAPASALDEAHDAMEHAVREAARDAVAAVQLLQAAEAIDGSASFDELSQIALIASGSLADVASRAAAYEKLINQS